VFPNYLNNKLNNSKKKRDNRAIGPDLARGHRTRDARPRNSHGLAQLPGRPPRPLRPNGTGDYLGTALHGSAYLGRGCCPVGDTEALSTASHGGGQGGRCRLRGSQCKKEKDGGGGGLTSGGGSALTACSEPGNGGSLTLPDLLKMHGESESGGGLFESGRGAV
jgi:hypothetical protein